MSKHLRLSEKWFNRGLWVISIVFAWFLIGLGSSVVDDLPRVEKSLQQSNFIDQTAMKPLQETLTQQYSLINTANDKLHEIQEQLSIKNKIYKNANESFDNWLKTRHATERADQDEELIARTKELDQFKIGVNQLDQQISEKHKAIAVLEIKANDIRQQVDALNDRAYDELYVEIKKQNLRVFLYRLAVTLPLLILAGWLFAKKRKSQYWPFAWGFIFFALFTFFVELVPYLPSYGGYVRYGVGIIITVLGGHYAIRGLQKYLARQKIAEAQPETVRRKELSYDVALVRLGKGVCPSCERSSNFNDPDHDFCPHCGISIFNHCETCQTRKSAFLHFCHKCGASSASKNQI